LIHFLTVSADYLIKADDVIEGSQDACTGKRQTDLNDPISCSFTLKHEKHLKLLQIRNHITEETEV
jgi:hypothetical protein